MKVVIPDKYRITKEYVDERIDERANETEEKVLESTQDYIDDKLRDFQMGEVDGLEEVIQKAESNSQEIEQIKEDLENFKCDCGDELKGRVDANELNINKILEVVDEPPIYVAPTLSVSLNPTIIEHKIPTRITIIPTFSQNDAGSSRDFRIETDGRTLFESMTIRQYNDNRTLNHGDTLEYKIDVNYSAGEIKNTTFGIPYPSTSIKDGTLSVVKTVKCYANTYYGVIDKDTITTEDVLKLTSKLNTSKSNTITYDLIRQRSILMYPKSFGTLSNIKDNNNFDYINSYKRSEIIYDGVDYYVYILIDPVTIDDFKQIFN